MPPVYSTPAGTPNYVNAGTSSYPIQPTQTVLTNGTIVVVWSQDAVNQKDIFAQLLDADGNPVGAPFLVNTTTLSDQIQPIVVGLPNGNFVVTWDSFGQDSYIEPPAVGPTSQYVYQYGIFQQLFDPDGNAIGGEEQVNTSAEGQQKDARVHVLSDGGYITAWYHANSITDDNPGINLFYQRFDENGETVGEQTLLPATIEDPNFPGQTVSFEVKFAALPNGNVAAAWSANGVPGFFVTVFDPNGTQVSQFGIDVLSFPYGQGYLEFVALPDGNLFVVHNTRSGTLNSALSDVSTRGTDLRI